MSDGRHRRYQEAHQAAVHMVERFGSRAEAGRYCGLGTWAMRGLMDWPDRSSLKTVEVVLGAAERLAAAGGVTNNTTDMAGAIARGRYLTGHLQFLFGLITSAGGEKRAHELASLGSYVAADLQDALAAIARFERDLHRGRR